MCTAVSWNGYFGRTLDLEYSYRERVTVTPRNFSLEFRNREPLTEHYAIIGMAHVEDGCPLYYDAVNERGLAMAGLNFPGSAHYGAAQPEKDNIAPFELIPWVLGRCATVTEAAALLKRANLTDVPFSDKLPLTPLHWMIADRAGAIAAEPMRDGLKVYDDPVGVLANDPPFPEQMRRLADHLNLTPEEPENRFSGRVELEVYSRGMGGIGLPGDWSSGSRFVRAAFVKENSLSGGTEKERIGQFFHVMDTVAVPRGCVRLRDGRQVVTVYTSCCDLERGVYYYTTYGSRRVTGVDMKRENLGGQELVCYPLAREEQIRMEISPE